MHVHVHLRSLGKEKGTPLPHQKLELHPALPKSLPVHTSPSRRDNNFASGQHWPEKQARSLSASRHPFMTGIGGLVFDARRGTASCWARLRAYFRRRWLGPRRFVVLCFRRTGSNLLCGILSNHPEVLMHNELSMLCGAPELS